MKIFSSRLIYRNKNLDYDNYISGTYKQFNNVHYQYQHNLNMNIGTHVSFSIIENIIVQPYIAIY